MDQVPSLFCYFLPLWWIGNLWGDAVRLWDSPVLIKLSPTRFSIHWWFLPESVICQIVLFLIPSFVYMYYFNSTAMKSLLYSTFIYLFIYISMNSWIVMHYSMGYNPLLPLFIFIWDCARVQRWESFLFFGRVSSFIEHVLEQDVQAHLGPYLPCDQPSL